MTRTLALHALILSAMVACRSGEITAGVSDSAFVATMVALTRINQDVARDSTSRAIARDSVLQARDLTADDIERAARALEDDPERAMALWTRIAREGSDSTTPAPGRPPRP
jgi:hypothetical protein